MSSLGAMQDFPLRIMRLMDHAERETPERHAEAGHDVQADQQSELKRAYGAIPQQHDGHDQPHEGSRNPDEVGGFVSPAHLYSKPYVKFSEISPTPATSIGTELVGFI